MLRIAGTIILIIVAFVVGVMFGRMDNTDIGALTQNISGLEQELAAQTTKNKNLKETLDLVKRQIQTDRIAYQELQRIVDSSETEREELRKKIEDQQRLLKSLREKLEPSGN